jgi:serine/threonine protein kinase
MKKTSAEIMDEPMCASSLAAKDEDENAGDSSEGDDDISEWVNIEKGTLSIDGNTKDYKAMFQFEKTISRTQSSIVELVRLTHGGRNKLFVCKKNYEGRLNIGCIVEALVLQKCKHPRVVSLDGLFYDPRSNNFMILPYYDRELSQEIGNNISRDALDKHLVCKGLAQALVYLHANGIIHRDIKPQNVVLETDGNPVLIDFGLCWSRDLAVGASKALGMQTVMYRAPEIAFKSSSYDCAVDMWSMGCLMWSVWTGKILFEMVSNCDLTLLAMHVEFLGFPIHPPNTENAKNCDWPAYNTYRKKLVSVMPSKKTYIKSYDQKIVPSSIKEIITSLLRWGSNYRLTAKELLSVFDCIE